MRQNAAMSELDIDAATMARLENVVDGLVAHTQGTIHRRDLRELVVARYTELAADAKVTTFLPVLAGNLALEQVEAQQQKIEQRLGQLPSILVLDEHNSTRSQAACALIKYYAPGRFRVASAGLKPNGELNPAVPAELGEVGWELTDAPTKVTPEQISDADYVIAIGTDGADWEDPAPNTVRWAIPDAATLSDQSVHDVLAAVDSHVRQFLRTINPDHELRPAVIAQPE
jgi:protein-tyrosine-phosphatase